MKKFQNIRYKKLKGVEKYKLNFILQDDIILSYVKKKEVYYEYQRGFKKYSYYCSR